jgi:transcription initiation factor TFIIH subunit 4
MKEPLSIQDLTLWVRPRSRKEKEEGITTMTRLHMVDEVRYGPASQRQLGFQLTEAFAKSLRHALTGGGQHQSFGMPCSTSDPHPVSVAFLDDFARSKWEAVLGYMVGSSGAVLGQDITMVDASVRKILEEGGLVQIKMGKPQITKAGFAFVLQETNTQVWKVLLQYAQAVEDREEVRIDAENPLLEDFSNRFDQLNMEPVDVLSFIFLLSSLELGQDYSTATLTPTQTRMLLDLHQFGIIYQHASDPSRFYPTRLATTLTSDSGALANSLTTANPSSSTPDTNTSAEKGFIIIETNFRLYAYTNSPLQIAVLSLFANLYSKYPNLVTGKMTRKSLARAIKKGITSAQIISYLATHAHPQMRKRNLANQSQPNSSNTASTDPTTSILPPTVVDTIQLWQLEGDRMKTEDGFLFRDFDSKAEYERPLKHAETLGVLVWKNEKKRMFFVRKETEVVNFIRREQERRKQGEEGPRDE